MPSCTQAAQFWGPELAGRGEARVNPVPSARDAPARPLPPAPESSTRARPRRDGQSTHNRQSNARPRSPPLGTRLARPTSRRPAQLGCVLEQRARRSVWPCPGSTWTQTTLDSERSTAPRTPRTAHRDSGHWLRGPLCQGLRAQRPWTRPCLPGPARRTSGCCSGRRSSSGGRTAPGRACAGRSCRPSTGTCPPAWCPGRSSRSRAAAHLGSRAGSHWLQP